MNDIRTQQPTQVTAVYDGRRKKKRGAGEAAETEAAGSAAVGRVEADIADSVPKTLRKKAK